ncbi:MAG: hypothetical protein CL471_18950 [Acidobacteria bacterium]|nr:hypothetical protein [Acidobacteriota bacterium]
MDFYIVLGLERSASLGEVKRAYRRLARKYHPDINPGDRTSAAVFRRVNEAYQILSDPAERRRYDARGTVPDDSPESSFEFQGFDFSATAEGDDASTFGDLFADVFQAGEPGDAAEGEGTDLHLAVRISLEEAIRGAERSVTLTRLDQCSACRGAGVLRMTEGRCIECRGTGSLRWARGHMVFSRSCTHCGGSGRQQHRVCERCSGEGTVSRADSVTVRIPPGVTDGGRVRVPARSHAGRRGAQPGDLYLTVEIEPHPLFTREGKDLQLVLPVTVHEAALGAKIDVPTLDGAARVRVPPGTQSGQRFRVRGRGVPAPAAGGTAGDLVVEVRLVLPRLVDERSKALLREFGRLNEDNVREEFEAAARAVLEAE